MLNASHKKLQTYLRYFISEVHHLVDYNPNLRTVIQHLNLSENFKLTIKLFSKQRIIKSFIPPVEGGNKLILIANMYQSFLQKYCGPTADEFQDDLHYKPLRVSDVRWNFEQFVINQQGKPVVRFSPDVNPLNLTMVISSLLPHSAVDNMSNEIPMVQTTTNSVNRKIYRIIPMKIMVDLSILYYLTTITSDEKSLINDLL